jgi:hypothetical protein
MLLAVSDVWCVKSSARMWPPSGLTAFGTLPAKTPRTAPAARAGASGSGPWFGPGATLSSRQPLGEVPPLPEAKRRHSPNGATDVQLTANRAATPANDTQLVSSWKQIANPAGNQTFRKGRAVSG